MPAAELYGIQRIEYLDDVLILSGAGVGGGSPVVPAGAPAELRLDAKKDDVVPTYPY
jgi:hypothetical protein